MKKVLLFAATAAAILSGCTKQFVDEPTTGEQTKNIGFETYVSNATKGVAKGGFEMGDRFKVIGATTGANAAFEVATPVFSKWVFDGPSFADKSATVSNYGNDVWRYENPVSWNDENTTFFAFSPVPEGAAGEQYGITYTAPADLTTIPSIEFEVKGGYDVAKTITDAEAVASRPLTKQQVDLLWVCEADQKKANRTVNLMFNHALTRLTFAVRSNAPAGHSIRINSIALKNVTVDGTLALAHDDTNKGNLDYVGGWVAGATKKNFAINLINNVASLIKDNDIHTLTDNDEALMMIPQDLTDVELELRYASSADGINWENYESGVAVEVNLGDYATQTHWNPNKQIRYVLNVTPGDVIGFTAEVEAWGDEGDIEFRSFEVGKDQQDITKMTLAAGDVITTLTDGAWITYAQGANAAADLSTTDVVAVAGEYTFTAKDNINTAAREDQIVVKHDNGNTTIIKVTQQAGNGIIKVSEATGDVMTVTLAAGDKIAVPQTKASATWVLVNGTALSADFTTVGEAKITVEANDGAKRAAIVVVTIDGKESTYTIEQAGIEVIEIDVVAAGKKVHDGLAGDVITLTTGGDWLTITDNGGAAAELTSVTAAGVYTIDVAANATLVARNAEFSIKSGAVTKIYKIKQAAGAAPVLPTEVAVALAAAGGEVLAGGFTLVDAGDYIEVVDGGDATFTDGNDAAFTGKVTTAGLYEIKADENSTNAALTATIQVSIAGVVTNYNVTVAAAVVVPPVVTPIAVPVAVLANGTIADAVTLAGETISEMVGCEWLLVDGTAMEAGEATGEISAEVNTGAERVATFTTTSDNGLTVNNYTVTQAGAII